MTQKEDRRIPFNLVCGNCLASEESVYTPTLTACSRCGLVEYCSRECQRAHWTANHKQHCIAKADGVPQLQKPSDVRKDVLSRTSAADAECSICLEVLSEASTCTLPCSHKYHKSCVAELRSCGAKQACPLCRAAMPLGPKESTDEAFSHYLQVVRSVNVDGASWSALPASAQQRLGAAITYWRAAANEGCSEAQFYLGSMFEKGRGVVKNDVESSQWYRKAADQGNVNAQYKLATCTRDGCGVVQNDVEAVQLFKKAADQGVAHAQLHLGVAYAKGQGVAQSDEEAAQWYRKAANQGDAKLQYAVGVHFMEGRGVAQNDEEAAQWFKKTAEKGHAQAQCQLGLMYADGQGVEKNGAEAVNWFKKAADQGHAEAQRRYAIYITIVYFTFCCNPNFSKLMNGVLEGV